MKNKKLLIISTLMCFIPILISLCFYNHLPEQVPIHWNAAGEINGYESKPVALLLLPLLLILIHILIIWLMDKDPKRQNIPSSINNLMYFLIPVLSIIINLYTLNTVLETGIDLNINTLISLLIGLMILFIGNYLPKCKQSYTVGIKTPWTLDDEDNWNKTHRLAGFLWMAGGLLIMLSVFFPTNIMSIYMISIVLIIAFIPFIYSYLLFKKKER